MRTHLSVLALSAIVYVSGSISPAARADDSGTPPAASGESIYRHLCSHCHGFKLVSSGAGAPDLRLFPADDKARFINTVLNGKGAMPPWKETLSADAVEALWSYVMATREGSGS